MIIENYGIRSDYQAKRKPNTVDADSGGTYWNWKRLRGNRHYQFPVYKFALGVIIQRRLESVIDVGCGPGLKLRWIHSKQPSLRVMGIDQVSAIEFCRRSFNWGEWYVDHFERTDRQVGPGVTAPCVICADVIEHLLDPDLLLNYLKKRLEADGFLIISTPERERLRGADCLHCPHSAHVREWSLAEFRRYLEAAGFRILDHQLVLPLSPGLHRFAAKALLMRFLRGKPLRTCQLVLAKIETS